MNSSELIIYRSDDGQTRIETRLEDETVWLTIDQMVELFDKSRSTINEHILNIYNEGELERPASMRKIGISDFSSALTKPTNFNKLDVIISVGYRVKSQRGTQFRIWATERLKEYIIKGYTINSEQLENLGGGNYWKDILNSIRATVVWESNRCFR
ncbi:MAG: virulence RhuM family protein [Chloracidobacterium sp.]|nr:virulence RhuM family protein [Chloracidobacterium sp.]